MAEPLIFISRFAIQEGRTEDFVKAAQGVVDLLEANPVRHHYLAISVNDEGAAFTNVQIHPDPDSMVEHMELITDHIGLAMEMLDLSSGVDRLFGTATEALMDQLIAWGTKVNRPLSGFTRLGPATTATYAPEPLVFVNTYRLLPGKADDFRAALPEWFAWIEAEHPRLRHFKCYLAEDDTTVTAIQVHPDAASLEFQLRLVAGRLHESWQRLIDWSTMALELYGNADPALVAPVQEVAGPEVPISVYRPTVRYNRLAVG